MSTLLHLLPQHCFHFLPLRQLHREFRPMPDELAGRVTASAANGFPPVPADSTRNKKFLNATPFGFSACNLFAKERGISKSTHSNFDSRIRLLFVLSQRVLYKRLQRFTSPIFTIRIRSCPRSPRAFHRKRADMVYRQAQGLPALRAGNPRGQPYTISVDLH